MAKKKVKKSASVKGNIGIQQQAMRHVVSEEQLQKGDYSIENVPNPHGEVYTNGQLKQHAAVKKNPLFHTLWRRNVINDRQYAILKWYDNQSEKACAKLRSSSDFSGRGGGSAASHIPTSEAAMIAADQIKWARSMIDADLVASFDAVMIDEISFVETARRERANRYVRLSISRAQRNEKTLFIKAIEQLAQAYEHRFGAIGRGIRSETYA